LRRQSACSLSMRHARARPAHPLAASPAPSPQRNDQQHVLCPVESKDRQQPCSGTASGDTCGGVPTTAVALPICMARRSRTPWRHRCRQRHRPASADRYGRLVCSRRRTERPMRPSHRGDGAARSRRVCERRSAVRPSRSGMPRRDRRSRPASSRVGAATARLSLGRRHPGDHPEALHDRRIRRCWGACSRSLQPASFTEPVSDRASRTAPRCRGAHSARRSPVSFALPKTPILTFPSSLSPSN